MKTFLAAGVSAIVLTVSSYADAQSCSYARHQLDDLKSRLMMQFGQAPVSTACAFVALGNAADAFAQDAIEDQRVRDALRLGGAFCIPYCLGNSEASCGEATLVVMGLLGQRSALQRDLQQSCGS